MRRGCVETINRKTRLHQVNNNYKTPFDYAYESKNKNTMKLLLKTGVETEKNNTLVKEIKSEIERENRSWHK